MKKLLFLGITLLSLSVYSQPKKPVSSSKPKAAVSSKTTPKTTPKTSSTAKTQNSSKMTNTPDTLVKISTIHGDMVVRLYENTPLHRANFIKLAQEGYFDGTIFHRVIGSFMIQGGDPDSKNPQPGAQYGMGGPSYTIPAEFRAEYIHKKGALAAARTNNPEKASSGSQFYIVHGQKYPAAQLTQMGAQTGVRYTPEQTQAYANLGGTPFLDMQYTVFGEVIEGLDVIDKIAAEPTMPGDRPKKDIVMKVSVVVK
jgi:cyclophilin family peptidyl-prolyl cis-trans isomerase